MKKNLCYQAMFQRRNMILEFILGLFFSICSWPRLVLEVFLRRNMGERYFSFIGVVFVFLFILNIPFKMAAFTLLFNDAVDADMIIWPNIGWFLFAGSFLYAGFQRRKEVKRLPSVFDFERFSMSGGESLPFFYTFSSSPRRIAVVLEPAVFVALGLVLLLFKQYVGLFMIVCAIIYSVSYMAAYYQGDHFIMDQIDQMICNEELVASFVDGRKPSETRGFEAYGRRPADPEMRRKVADSFFAEESETVEAF